MNLFVYVLSGNRRLFRDIAFWNSDEFDEKKKEKEEQKKEIDRKKKRKRKRGRIRK